ncbi:MAG: hypothetical protein QOI21_413 [Actinomycetota bacterium]|jgi:hypothetical protein|nr:hypothetical protein [Actinomycetota bacterium]
MSELALVSNLLDEWDQLVGFIEEGYHDNIDEYRFDLRVRGALEELVRAPDLPEWTREKLVEIDSRLRAVLRPERAEEDPAVPWWLARIPRYAGQELADNLATWYGVQVEVR